MAPPGHYQRGTGPHKAFRVAAAVKAAAPAPEVESKSTLPKWNGKAPEVTEGSEAKIKPEDVAPKTEDISLDAIADTEVNNVSPTTESGEPPDENDLKSDFVNSQKSVE